MENSFEKGRKIKKALRNVSLGLAAAGVIGAGFSKTKGKIDEYVSNSKEYEKYKSDFLERKKQFGDPVVNDQTEIFDLQKEWLLAQMKTPEYRQRLIGEGLSEDEIDERIERLENTPVNYYNQESFPVTGNLAESGVSAAAFFAPLQGAPEILVALENSGVKRGEAIVVHEAQHAATDGNNGMSSYAKNLYQKAFVKNKESADALEQYFEDFTEMDARKKQLDYDLEVLGIKKYNEPFTDDMMPKVMDAYNNNWLSYGAKVFLDHIDKKYLKEIMNTIADNQFAVDEDYNKKA